MRGKLILPFLAVGAIFMACTELIPNSIDHFSSLEMPTLPTRAISETEASTEEAVDVSENTSHVTALGANDTLSDSSDEATFVNVDDSYFDDAVFLGDSRIVGLYDYSNWENADFFCTSGMNVYTLFEDPPKRKHDGNWPKNIALLLQEKQYRKVYIMLGINEMGIGDAESFAEAYGQMLAQVQELQPNAIIYIMSIMKVTPERDAQGDYINNAGINDRNQLIASFADNKTVFYLNVNPAVCNFDTGALIPEYTGDGVHLYAKYIYLWTDYLKSHAVPIE